MPTLDVTPVLDSPEFQTSFEVTRYRSAVGEDGFSRVSSADHEFVTGVVSPGRYSARRMDDGTRMTASIDVWCRHRLSAGYKRSDSLSRPADVITWRGRRYTVMSVDDFSEFGPGFVHASCDLQQMNPDSPTET